MDVKKIIASDDYDELKTQFNALKAIVRSQQVQLQLYQSKIKLFSLERVVQLEAELESEREMNAILTEELDKLE